MRIDDVVSAARGEEPPDMRGVRAVERYDDGARLPNES
jgi:hypothetical protein